MDCSTFSTPGRQPVLDRLGSEDDAALWQVALDHILAQLEKKHGVTLEVGQCSHWLRPHQTRWTADGGFAWPTGYGGTRFSRTGLPLFDWSVILEWTGEAWAAPSKKPKHLDLRIALPSRTTRHQQAALHTLWRHVRVMERRFYGFRKKDGAWKCTAETEWAEDHNPARRRRFKILSYW